MRHGGASSARAAPELTAPEPTAPEPTAPEPTPGPAAAGLVVLDHGEDVALWRALGLGPRPALLEVPDHGDTLAARAAADHAALDRLARAGRVDAHGRPDRALADALRVLARPDVELDARTATPDGCSALVAAADGVVTVLARRDLARRLHLRLGPPALAGHEPSRAVVDALLDVLPPHPPAPGRPVRVPAGTVLGRGPLERRARVARVPLPPATRRRLDVLLADRPHRVVRLGGARRTRDGPRRRAAVVLTVVDARPGRVLVRHVGDEVELRPLPPGELRHELLALLAVPGPAAGRPGR